MQEIFGDSLVQFGIFIFTAVGTLVVLVLHAIKDARNHAKVEERVNNLSVQMAKHDDRDREVQKELAELKVGQEGIRKQLETLISFMRPGKDGAE